MAFGLASKMFNEPEPVKSKLPPIVIADYPNPADNPVQPLLEGGYTGIPVIDKAIGKVHVGEIITFICGTGVGKTSMAQHFAEMYPLSYVAREEKSGLELVSKNCNPLILDTPYYGGISPKFLKDKLLEQGGWCIAFLQNNRSGHGNLTMAPSRWTRESTTVISIPSSKEAATILKSRHLPKILFEFRLNKQVDGTVKPTATDAVVSPN
jgi:hypothetical protein